MDISTRPYLIRAIYEWCIDNSFTPYLAVRVNSQTSVPTSYVKNGQIVLNLSTTATRHLQMQNDFITFASRFNGVSFDIVVPIGAVEGIFARENGEGLMFPPAEDEYESLAEQETIENEPISAVSQDDEPPPPPASPSADRSLRSHLKVVK